MFRVSYYFSPLFYFFIEVYLIYNVVLISAVQQSDSVFYMYIVVFQCMYTYHIFFIHSVLDVLLQVGETVTELRFKIVTKPDTELIPILQLYISIKEYRILSSNPKTYLCLVS